MPVKFPSFYSETTLKSSNVSLLPKTIPKNYSNSLQSKNLISLKVESYIYINGTINNSDSIEISINKIFELSSPKIELPFSINKPVLI